jgi:hypothetical protein
VDLLLNVLARTSPVTGFRIANLRGGEEVVNRANERTFCPVHCSAGHDLDVEAAATEAQEAGLGPEWITRVQSLFRHFA